MSPRSPLRRGLITIATAGALVALTACEGAGYGRADAARQQAGLSVLTRSPLLQDSARANSARMCDEGLASPSSDPVETYDRETISAASELVGLAPLDPGISDPLARNVAATNVILDSWSNPPWSDPAWDSIGVGEVECPDGNLYLTAATTAEPTMPATGRYSSRQYTLAQIDENLGLQYGTATNYLGQNQSLLLDLYAPPSTGVARPLVILVHGGGFAFGDRSNMASTARDYARRGFVAVSLGYRLNPTLPGFSDLPAYLAAGANAIDDGMESVRWLRSNAATFEIDPDRVAMMGTSAGGGVALGTATIEDPTPGGPLGHVSPRIQAAVATGATLTLGLDAITFGETPIMMIHYEIDSATRATTADVDATCDALWALSGTCDRVILTGTGHGSPLGGGGPWWGPEIGPYLWQHLDLG